MARPPKGPRLVDGLGGSTHAKTRLRVILETLAGACPLASACERLGINEAAFHRLRLRTLQDALASLEPRPLGRPKKVVTPEEMMIAALRAKIETLQRDLDAAHLREEIAVTLPYIARKQGRSAEKKTTSPRHPRKPKRR